MPEPRIHGDDSDYSGCIIVATFQGSDCTRCEARSPHPTHSWTSFGEQFGSMTAANIARGPAADKHAAHGISSASHLFPECYHILHIHQTNVRCPAMYLFGDAGWRGMVRPPDGLLHCRERRLRTDHLEC